MQSAGTSDRKRRIARIQRRGISELVQCMEQGQLGLKLLEHISGLPKAKQRVELSRCLEVRRANAERQAAWRKDHFNEGYASNSYVAVRSRRIRRIGRSATSELRAAFDAGQLSLRRYDLLSRLPTARQRKALEVDRRMEEGQCMAARAIQLILTRNPERIDLAAVASEITESIRSCKRIIQ